MKKEQWGFTLIEILIALFLSAILFSISAKVFVQSGLINSLAHQQMIMDDAASVSKYFLERDIRRAGFYFSLKNKDIITGTKNVKDFQPVCLSNDEDFPAMLEPFIFGLNNTSKNFSCIKDNAKDSDVLTLRYLNPVIDTKTNNSAKHKLYMRISANEATLFKAKDQGYYKNQITTEHSELFEVKTYIYYVRNTGRQCQGDDIYGLYREYNTDKGFMRAEEIVSGVEQIQFRYLIDNKLLNADQINTQQDWEKVEAISTSLLLRANCSNQHLVSDKALKLEDFIFYPNKLSNFQRQAYQFDIGLRNFADG